jgi:predicted permease
MMGQKPPRAARALIERALPAELRETVCADLDEMFRRRVERHGATRARAWYVTQALTFAGRFAWERVRERVGGKRAGGRAADGERGGIRISLLDWKLGVRMLVKYPGLSVIGVLALATGIAIGSALFQLTMMELWPNLPLDEGDRIVRIDQIDGEAIAVERRSLHDFLLWRGTLTSIRELGVARTVLRNIVGSDGRAVPEEAAEITASAFPLTRVPPLLGRPLSEADEQVGAPDVVVIGYRVWQNRFAGDPQILGRVVQVGRTRATVVGVMPEGFAFPEDHGAWLPLRIASAPEPREGPPVLIFGRLADGASMATAQAELTAVGERMAMSNPGTHAHLQPKVMAFAARAFSSPTGASYLVGNLMGLLVIVALCANVASLMFARTAMRESEVVVRTALGASRGRIIGQMMVEVFVLALVAAAVGLSALSGLFAYASPNSDRPAFWRELAVQPSTVAYAIGLAVLCAGLASILPALKATGSRVQEGLKVASGGNTSMGFGRVWSGIIVFQVAVTVIALPVGVSFLRDALRNYRVRSAFPSSEYLTFRAGMDENTDAPEASEDALRQRAAGVFAELERRLEEEPGVLAITVAGALPGMYHPQVKIEAQRGSEAPQPVEGYLDGGVMMSAVDPGFFDAFRIPVVAGRGLNDGDIGVPNTPIVVNESLAEKLGGSALGVRVRTVAAGDQPAGEWYEIVGVVQNVGMDPTDEGEAEFYYQPVGFAELTAPLVAVRISGDPGPLAAKVETIVAQIDAGFRVHEVSTLDEIVTSAGDVLATLTAIGTNVLCILLSAASLFAVMAVGVARRSREIGIRLALGASKRGVLSALFARAAKQLGVGVVVGNVIFASLLVYYDAVEAETLISLVGVSLLMGCVGLLACAVPARRALRIRPTQALRE